INLPRFCAAAAHAALAARVVGVLAWRVLGFRIGDIEPVVLVDPDAARSPELLPRVEELAVLIEDVHAAVAAVSDEESSLRVEGDHVRTPELAFVRPEMAERHHELPVLVELHDARVAKAWRMPFRDEDVTVGSNSDRRRLIENIQTRAALSGLAER